MRGRNEFIFIDRSSDHRDQALLDLTKQAFHDMFSSVLPARCKFIWVTITLFRDPHPPLMSHHYGDTILTSFLHFIPSKSLSSSSEFSHRSSEKRCKGKGSQVIR